MKGLSNKEAARRLKKYGLNKIQLRTLNTFNIFLRQLKFPFTYILVIAGIVSLFLHQNTDAIMIFAFILINLFLGFYLEYKSQKTVDLLQQKLALKAKVLRDGVWINIEADKLVIGDIVEISNGNIVPAEIKLIKVDGLAEDDSSLTGESEPIYKRTKETAYAGSVIISGKAIGEIVAVGKNTHLAKIADLASKTQRISTFEKQINKFSKVVLWLVIIAIAIIFLINFLLKGSTNLWEYVFFSIALAVSVIPEALPVVVTFSFARGASILAKEKVIVKRLSSIEDLGSIEILCTDKTGTLTESKMQVADIYQINNNDIKIWATPEKGNPFEDAIISSLTEDEKRKLNKLEIVDKKPFDSRKRYDLIEIKDRNCVWEIIRGAPESVYALCSKEIEKEKIFEWTEQRGCEGKRVLAIAKKRKNSKNEFEFLGMISFLDPIKLTSFDAIKKAQDLGVSIKILTGDRVEVATYVAKEIGLIKNQKEVITGEVFAKLSIKKKKEIVDRITVFARVLPEQKYEIIKILQEKYQVGYLGDGVNDAPALKLANVAMVVEGASDVAREASDILFLKKDLKIIINGINIGRMIFSNTTKYITATLSANFGNFFAIASASLLINSLPMLPIQILLVNLLSDFPMIAMASDTTDINELEKPNRYDMKETLSLAGVLGGVSSVFDFIFFIIFVRFGSAFLQTGWFIESILSELIFIFSVRTKKVFYKAIKPSFLLLFFTLIASLTTIILPLTNWGIDTFSFVKLGNIRLIMIFVIVVVYFIATETAKLIFYHSRT